MKNATKTVKALILIALSTPVLASNSLHMMAEESLINMVSECVEAQHKGRYNDETIAACLALSIELMQQAAREMQPSE